MDTRKEAASQSHLTIFSTPTCPFLVPIAFNQILELLECLLHRDCVCPRWQKIQIPSTFPAIYVFLFLSSYPSIFLKQEAINERGHNHRGLSWGQQTGIRKKEKWVETQVPPPMVIASGAVDRRHLSPFATLSESSSSSFFSEDLVPAEVSNGNLLLVSSFFFHY